jgi:phospholipase C
LYQERNTKLLLCQALDTNGGFMRITLRAILSMSVVLLAACGGSSSSSPGSAIGTGPGAAPPTAAPTPTAAGSPTPVDTPIQHVVIIIQENRSVPNLFAGYPGADAPTFGFGSKHPKTRIPLQPIDFSPPADVNHYWAAGITEWNNGAMNGFDRVPVGKPLPPTYMYSYVRRPLVKPYWDMAQQYVFDDHMFPTEFGPSFTAHQNLIAGSTEITPGEALVDMPDDPSQHTRGDCDAPKGTTTNLITSTREYLKGKGPFPCLDYPSAADVLDPANVSWKFYRSFWPGGASIWDAFGAIRKVRYGPDWQHDVSQSNFEILKDAAAGTLPNVSWVIPTLQDSDHPGAGSDRGPSWVANVVDAIGTGPEWSSTAIIVVWDEWGGWYDDVPPPNEDYRGLGIRVPCLIISPYARKGYVDHRQYESGSVLKTVEEIFHTGYIGTTDVRSNDMLDAFDFSQKPRRFRVIHAKYSQSDFLTERPTGWVVFDPDE